MLTLKCINWTSKKLTPVGKTLGASGGLTFRKTKNDDNSMIKKIIILFFVLTKFGFAQTAPEMLLLGLGNAIRENGIPSGHLEAKFHNGLIVINADTIKGQIKIGGGGVFFFNDSVEKCIKKNKPFIRKVASVVFFPFINKDPKKNYIKAKKITFVRLYAADSLITKNGYMDFIHIGKSPSLSRRIYSGSVEIFDNNYCTDEYPGYIEDGLVVLDSGKIITAYNSAPKKYLVNYINKKFNKDFKTSDFKRRIDVIYWLKRNDINSVDRM
ncbi:MAG: hypothetical protein ABIP51_14710 [Bacteroidia bacterium]